MLVSRTASTAPSRPTSRRRIGCRGGGLASVLSERTQSREDRTPHRLYTAQPLWTAALHASRADTPVGTSRMASRIRHPSVCALPPLQHSHHCADPLCGDASPSRWNSCTHDTHLHESRMSLGRCFTHEMLVLTLARRSAKLSPHMCVAIAEELKVIAY